MVREMGKNRTSVQGSASKERGRGLRCCVPGMAHSLETVGLRGSFEQGQARQLPNNGGGNGRRGVESETSAQYIPFGRKIDCR